MVRHLRCKIKHLFTASLFVSRIATAQVDEDASVSTVTLYENLKHIQNSAQFLFGQEFFNSFRYSSGSAHDDESYSDSKSVTGSHPAVLGSDFHYYLEKDAIERSYHTEAVRWAYRQGYVITFDWHLSGRGTTTYEYVPVSQNLVNNIVDDIDGDRDWFFEELDKVIYIINNDLVADGEKIPIVFRPLHEMNGGWFWWGTQATTPENYIILYRMLVDYVRGQTNTVLFCWSPNAPTNFDFYPGDDYVDVLGLDAYEVNDLTVRSQLAPIIDHAQENNKVAVFSETGYRSNGGTIAGDNSRSTYWKDTVLPAILGDPAQKAHKIAWVLTWINASWSVPYVPHANSSTDAKQSFIDFKNSPYVVFGNEIPDMYSPIPIVGIPGNRDKIVEIIVHPLPVQDQLNITLSGFEKAATAMIYDARQRMVHKFKIAGEVETLNTKNILSSGLYFLMVSDGRNTSSIKFAIN
jgi:mannan endo-1,4-beta-mannosidase